MHDYRDAGGRARIAGASLEVSNAWSSYRGDRAPGAGASSDAWSRCRSRASPGSTDLQEEGERLMSEKPYLVRNWKRVCSGMGRRVCCLPVVPARMILTKWRTPPWSRTAMAAEITTSRPIPIMADWDFSTPGTLSPRMTCTVIQAPESVTTGGRVVTVIQIADIPATVIRVTALVCYGSDGPVTRSYSLPAHAGAPNSVVAADRAYIRQLEERIRKLENANKQSLPAYGERLNGSSWPSSNAAQSVYKTPAAGQFGQPTYPAAASSRGSHSEYPVFQPSYGGPPMYRFRQ